MLRFCMLYTVVDCFVDQVLKSKGSTKERVVFTKTITNSSVKDHYNEATRKKREILGVERESGR